VAGAGDLPTAMTLVDTGLAARDGSSVRGWADLTAYRDALAAPSGRRRPRPKVGNACGVS